MDTKTGPVCTACGDSGFILRDRYYANGTVAGVFSTPCSCEYGLTEARAWVQNGLAEAGQRNVRELERMNQAAMSGRGVSLAERAAAIKPVVKHQPRPMGFRKPGPPRPPSTPGAAAAYARTLAQDAARAEANRTILADDEPPFEPGEDLRDDGGDE